jgi:copper transport protein
VRRTLRLLVLLAALLGGGLALAASAQAHATVTASDPADGARLRAVPAQVSVTFDEAVTIGSLGYLHVTDEHGRRVDSGAAFHPGGDAAKVAVRLRAGLGDGTYVESFRVVSADSHPVAGIVRFVVGNGALAVSTAAPSATTDGATSAAFDAARWISYGGLALLGAAWLPLTVWPAGREERRTRRLVWTGWWAAVAGAVLELLLQGPYAAGDGPGAIGDGSLLDGTLHTAYGQLHSIRLVLLGLLAVLLGAALRSRARRPGVAHVVWPVAVGIALTFSAAGHPDTTDPRWLSIALDVAHLTAMTAWVGGLVLMVGALLPKAAPADLARALPVFSRVAFGAVVTLAVTGTYAAWRGIGAWRAVLGTEYGLLVVVKVVLFLGLIALGNVSRRVINRRTLGTPAHRERLRRGVLVEVAVAGLVLVATAVLVDQPRGREALAAADRSPVSASASLGAGRSVSVTVDPGTHGPVTTEVTLDGGAAPQRVTATAAQKQRGLGPIPVPLQREAPQLWGASAVNLPAAGTWTFEVVVTTSAFDATTVDVAITLH